MSTRVFFAKLVASLSRHVRFPGRQRLLLSIFPPDYFRRIEPCEFVVPYDQGLKFRCDLGSWIEWNIFFKGYYAPDLSMCIKRLIQPGMQVVDVGANVGAYTLIMAKQAGESGNIVSFEPNPEIFQRLQENIVLNQFEKRVTLKQIALSDKRGEEILWLPRADHFHRGISSLNRYVETLTEQIPVKVEKLDDIFVGLGTNRLDFIKIDTEGHDALIINGAADVINRFRPIIVFEANYLAHSEAETILEKTRSKLLSLGYQFFTVGYFGRLKKCPDELPLPDSDIVCIPGTL
jgi:FkbM family methyltransferase